MNRVLDLAEDPNALAALERRLEVLASEPPEADSRGREATTPEAAASGRWRLLAAIDDSGRFARFVPSVAVMADVSEETARVWLDSVWGATPRWEMAAPHARAWWVEGGPKARNALRGFVHVVAGKPFPHHKHLGAEHVLVLQGGATLSTGQRLRAGDTMSSEPGEEHSFEATPAGPDLLVFTVAFEGLDFGRFVARPR